MKWKTDLQHKYTSNQHMKLQNEVVSIINYLITTTFFLVAPNSIQDISSPTNNQTCVRCESWTIKKAECRRIDAFELWC